MFLFVSLCHCRPIALVAPGVLPVVVLPVVVLLVVVLPVVVLPVVVPVVVLVCVWVQW